MKLNTDHKGVCKFGESQMDRDNLKLVRSNIRDIYRNTLKNRELKAIPSVIGREGGTITDEDMLRARFINLRGYA